MSFAYNDRAHIVLYQGDSLNIRVPVEDQDGEPVDISGATIEWMIADSVDGIPEVTLTDTAGITINNNSMFTINIDGTDTSGLQGVYYPELDASLVQRPTRRAIDNSYYHECRVTSNSGASHIVFSGLAFVRTSLIEGQA